MLLLRRLLTTRQGFCSRPFRPKASSPRVMHTHLRPYIRRIYVRAFWISFGLREIYASLSSTSASHALPVRRTRALPYRLPSDSGSPRTPLPSANSSPDRACKGTFTLRVNAPCRAHIKRKGLPREPFFYKPFSTKLLLTKVSLF
jgi:hypothetical protein